MTRRKHETGGSDINNILRSDDAAEIGESLLTAAVRRGRASRVLGENRGREVDGEKNRNCSRHLPSAKNLVKPLHVVPLFPLLLCCSPLGRE